MIVAALLLPALARATLLVAVPSAGGLVIAVDSRTTFRGVQCDDQYKITELKKPYRTVVAVTGDVAFIRPPGAQEMDVCRYLQSAPRLLDIASVIRGYFERRVSPLSALSLEDLSSACVAAVQQFQKSLPQALEPYAGREIFSVVIASYDPHSKTSVLLNFVVRMDAATHGIRADRLTRSTISPQSRRGVWAFGEADYLNRNVFGGFGRQYLSQATQDFILMDKPVSEAPLDQSVAVAVDIIKATSRAASVVPAPSGIGGPIHVVLLGRERRAQQIQ